MNALYVLDVPENVAVPKVAAEDPAVTVGRIGPYFVISSEGPIVIDRRAVGARHAVWYSCIAGVSPGSHITQHDKNALRVETGTGPHATGSPETDVTGADTVQGDNG